MHKNKHRKEKKKNKWLSIIEWGIVIAVGSVLGIMVSNWLNTLSFMQPHYAKPSELSFQNGLPILIGYCIGLVVTIIAGYILMKRMDDNGLQESASKPYQHKPLAQNSGQKRTGR
jgi:H+/gluconate symporter-like permease